MIEFTNLNINQKIKFFSLNFQAIIAAFGIVGNILTYCVFGRKRLKNSSYSFYFRIIAILDSITLLSACRYWARFFLNLNLDLISPLLCKLNDYQPFVTGLSSTWLLTVILVDRIATIIYHNRCQIFKRRWFQTALTVIVITSGLIMHSTMPLNYELNHVSVGNSSQIIKKCFLPYRYLQMNTLIAFANTFSNSIINMILYIKLIVFIFRSRKKITTRTNQRLARDLKFSISSIALTVINFLSKLPFGISILLASRLNLNEEEFQAVFAVATTIVSVSHSVTFVVNYLLNSIFHEEFHLMISSKCC